MRCGAKVYTSSRKEDACQAAETRLREHGDCTAIPFFARVVSEPDVTGTFKLKKMALQEKGWDLDRVRDELDDTPGAYVPLTRDIVADIESGNVRL